MGTCVLIKTQLTSYAHEKLFDSLQIIHVVLRFDRVQMWIGLLQISTLKIKIKLKINFIKKIQKNYSKQNAKKIKQAICVTYIHYSRPPGDICT